jgi:hypothetical protein
VASMCSQYISASAQVGGGVMDMTRGWMFLLAQLLA